MKLDPHIHSIYSGDARGTPLEIIEQSRKIGLNAIAISDHNTIKGSQLGLKEVKQFDDILLIPSIEITSLNGHIVGLGATDLVKRDMTPEETIDTIHDFDGIAIIPHPYSMYRSGLFVHLKPDPLVDMLDAVETKNSRFIIGYSNWRTKKLSVKYNLPEMGASDSHFIKAIGSCYTEVNSSLDISNVLKAIKKGKTKAMGHRTSQKLILKEVFNKKVRTKL